MITKRLGRGSRRRGLVGISLSSGRMDLFKRLCKLEGDRIFDEMVKKNPLVRNPKRLVNTFHLQELPSIQAISPYKHHTLWWPAVTLAFYHGDEGAGRSRAHPMEVAQNLKALADRREYRKMERAETQFDNTLDGHMARSLHEHLLQKCRSIGPGFIFSLEGPPASSVFVSGLQELQSAPLRQPPLSKQVLRTALPIVGSTADEDPLAIEDEDALPSGARGIPHLSDATLMIDLVQSAEPPDAQPLSNRVFFCVVNARAGISFLAKCLVKWLVKILAKYGWSRFCSST